MVWTATHRFVVLAMHVAHQGDDELQEDEQVALVDACIRFETEADVPEDKMIAMVEEAVRAYEHAVEEGIEEALVADAVASLGGTFPQDVLRSLLDELRHVAVSHAGVDPAERAALARIERAWRISIA